MRKLILAPAGLVHAEEIISDLMDGTESPARNIGRPPVASSSALTVGLRRNSASVTRGTGALAAR